MVGEARSGRVRASWGRLRRFLGKTGEEKRRAIRWHVKGAWNRVLPVVPTPTWLPWGFLWLAGSGNLDRVIFAAGAEDPPMTRVVCALLRPGMVVLDVGANHGFYTMLAAKRVGAEGTVIAFEPSARERNWLRLHLWMNRVRGPVVIEAVAVADHTGRAEFFVVRERSGAHNSLSPVQAEPSTAVTVDVTTLDRYTEQRSLDRVDLVKIDVEGAELEVLRGSVNLLGRAPRPYVMCDLDKWWVQRFAHELEDVYDFLAQRDFQWFAATRWATLRPVTRDEVLRGAAPQNLIAVPEERRSHVGPLLLG